MSPGRRRWPRTVRRLAELLVVGFILEYFVVPQIGGTHKAIHVLAAANPFLPVLWFIDPDSSDVQFCDIRHAGLCVKIGLP